MIPALLLPWSRQIHIKNWRGNGPDFEKHYRARAALTVSKGRDLSSIVRFCLSLFPWLLSCSSVLFRTSLLRRGLFLLLPQDCSVHLEVYIFLYCSSSVVSVYLETQASVGCEGIEGHDQGFVQQTRESRDTNKLPNLSAAPFSIFCQEILISTSIFPFSEFLTTDLDFLFDEGQRKRKRNKSVWNLCHFAEQSK